MSAELLRGSSTRIAMWSGPRNISTALMRSFAARGDCEVVDEPLYGHYLAVTRLHHPGAAEVMAAQPTDWRDVVDRLQAPGAAPVRYVKHMAHHLLDDVGREWLDGWRHAYLIRDPAAMVASLAKVLPYPPRLVDTGLPQQVELFRRRGGPVLAAEDVLAGPASTLSLLCEAMGIPWTDRMLSWPAGPHPSDGVWADHWYGQVRASTGFTPPPTSVPTVPVELERLVEQAEVLHAELAAARLTA